MSNKISTASQQIQQCLDEIKKLEKDFNQTTDNVSRSWQDKKQREFYDKYIRELSEALKNAINDINSISLQVLSIESKLNSYK